MIARRHRTAAALAGALIFPLALAACGGSDGRQAADGENSRAGSAGPPVVLVSIDTLRSDRLPAYGYDGVETPHLDSLRGDSILFSHAYSHIPLTLPSHASMLTGLLPPDHGVRDNIGYTLEPDGLPYLPRLLKERGYTTGAAVSSFVLRGASGISADFDFFDDEIASGWESDDLGRVQRTGLETLERTRPWLESVAGRPFFLFFHLYEPHTPFAPPEPYRSRYESAYDGEVAAADAVVGALVGDLKRLGVYEEALIVVTSDHGEGLGEHGYLEHGPFLYREALQVPLLVKLPDSERAGETVDAPAQLIDLLPTVAEVLGFEAATGVRGRSLLTLRSGEPPRDIYAETYFPRLHFGWNDLASILRYPEQYIHGPDPELYDLATDPAQTHNLLAERRARTTELKRALDGYDRRLAPPASADEETRRNLAALGYVGSTSGGILEGALPDPKSRVHVLSDMADGVHALDEGRPEEAATIFRRVSGEEPLLVDAWKYLGDAELAAHRPADALAAYRQAFELSGNAPHHAIAVANALLRLGRFDEAKAHIELAGDEMPIALDIRAQAEIRLEEIEAAGRTVERLLAERGSRVSPLITAAELRLAEGRFADALALTDEAIAAFDDPRAAAVLDGLYFIRGKALTELGDAAEAEAAFREEIRRAPEQLPAYTHLAFLHALQQNGPEAGRTLQAMVETNPTPDAYAEAVLTMRAMGDEASAAAVLRQALGRWPNDERLRSLADQQALPGR